MSSNQATNNGEDTTAGVQAKKAISQEAVRSALQERIDMMRDDGTAGAA